MRIPNFRVYLRAGNWANLREGIHPIGSIDWDSQENHDCPVVDVKMSPDEIRVFTLSSSSFGFRLDDDENIKLMESTGLTDVNGKEIFEGDILQIENYYVGSLYEDGKLTPLSNPYIGEVKWGEAKFVLYNNGMYFCHGTPDGWPSLAPKVIGNIYEHPHLLKTES